MAYAPVAGETFELAYGERLALNAEHAGTFTLGLLRAYTSAHAGKAGVESYHLGSALYVALCETSHESGYVNAHRAGLHAAGLGAAQAACGLKHGLFLIVAKAYFFKIGRSLQRILFAHRSAGYLVSFSCHGRSIYGFRD